MSDDILDRARAALDGVTEGPWRVDTSSFYYDIWAFSGTPEARPVIQPDPGPKREDAEFIAAARMLVSEMADEIERLRAELGLYREDNEMRWRER